MKAVILCLIAIVLASGCMLASKNQQAAPQLKVYGSTTSTVSPFTPTSTASSSTISDTITYVTTTSTTTTTLLICPDCSGIDLKTSKWLLNLRPAGQVPSYQTGYFDCKDEILEGLDIVNRSRFRERPKFSNDYTKPVEVDNVACYLVNKTGWIVLNHTQADFKVIDNKLLLRPLKVKILGQP